jgi:hypothetical protein
MDKVRQPLARRPRIRLYCRTYGYISLPQEWAGGKSDLADDIVR